MEEEVIKKVIKVSKTEIQHIVALVSGILGILFSIVWYIGLIHGITAIVCGARTSSRYKSKLGRAGLILGIIATSFSGISFIIVLLGFLYVMF